MPHRFLNADNKYRKRISPTSPLQLKFCYTIRSTYKVQFAVHVSRCSWIQDAKRVAKRTVARNNEEVIFVFSLREVSLNRDCKEKYGVHR